MPSKMMAVSQYSKKSPFQFSNFSGKNGKGANYNPWMKPASKPMTPASTSFGNYRENRLKSALSSSISHQT